MASGTPNEPRPLVSFTLVLGAAPSVCAPGPFPNTRSLFLTNLSADAGLLHISDFLLGAPVMSATNSMVLPPTSTVVLELGPEGERASLTTTGAFPPDRLVIWLQAENPLDTPSINITYVQSRGYIGQGGHHYQ